MRAGNDFQNAIGWARLPMLVAGRELGFDAGGRGANAAGRRRSGHGGGGRNRGGSRGRRCRHHEGHRRQQARLEPAQCRCVDPAGSGAEGKRRVAKPPAASIPPWSANQRANGTSAVSVKQSMSPFWDTRIGADMTVARQGTATTSELLSEKLANGGSLPQSSGTAWAAITAPGVASIWDKTSVEARVDPGSEQSRLGTSLSKSLPLGEQYFADAAERLQSDPAGHRAGARHRQPSGAQPGDRPVGEAEHHRHRHQPDRRPDAVDRRTTNGCARSAPSRSCSTASPSRARSAKPPSGAASKSFSAGLQAQLVRLRRPNLTQFGPESALSRE